jgi:hypothetical protein
MTASTKLVVLSAVTAILAASVYVAGVRGAAPAPGYVGAPGSEQAEPPTAAELGNVRAQITTWLERNGFRGYRVAEVRAFTNGDYVVVQTKNGADAFELIASPGAGWLMLSPTSMLWNKRYGMARSFETNWSGSGMMPVLMGGGRAAGQWNGWFDAGTGLVETPAAAMAAANRWLARAHPGERATSLRSFPGFVTISTTYRGKKAGLISVNSASGAVWYHGWLGGFLAGRTY